MSDSTIRMFRDGRFSNIPAPAWFEEAIRLRSAKKLDWQDTIACALSAEPEGLTVNRTGPLGLDITFWRSPQHGIYVEIDCEICSIDRVLIPDAVDWLPFLSAHLTPLLAAVSQVTTAAQLERIANALISFARHEHGDHINRSTGRSRIDERRDEEDLARFRAELRKGAAP